MDKDKIKILFLCTSNSCRSQMAEGWTKHLKSDCVEPFSAGIKPGRVSRRATEVMAEAGVDISHQRSKHVDEFSDVELDYVVTVCDNASRHCPTFPGRTKVVHKGFDDPSEITGTNEEVMTKFRRIRDEMKSFIESLPAALAGAGE